MMRYCGRCGAPLSEGAQFCGLCGADHVAPMTDTGDTELLGPSNGSMTNAGSTEPLGFANKPMTETGVAGQPRPANGSMANAGTTEPLRYAAEPLSVPLRSEQKNRKPFRARLIVISLVALAVLVGGWFGIKLLLEHRHYTNVISDAEEKASSVQPEEAVDYINTALQEYPDDKALMMALDQAQFAALEDAVAKAETALASGEFDKAYNDFKNLPIEQGDAAYAKYAAYLDTLMLCPGTGYADVSAFPFIKVHIPHSGSGNNLTTDDFVISEDDGEIQEISFFDNGTEWILEYTAPDVYSEEEIRSVSVRLDTGGFSMPIGLNYLTPILAPATLTLISTDFSEYPTVRTYYRVRDADSGDSVQKLMSNSFQIRERFEGGEYLYREVSYAGMLKDTQGQSGGINFDLVADKSDSISYYDMDKIKKVMKEFCANLRFSMGDRAEVIAFDSVVQQMCTYTDKIEYLNNGIDNMSTDGMTAFYDAVYTGVRNASLQSGARCVIAFTDGKDNESYYSAYNVIDYANARQVPLYLIGVGDADTAVMRQMANMTGGRYWDIDDLYDLEIIYREIYTELLDMYVVEYITDPIIPDTTPRELVVKVSGEGFRGETVSSFTPTMTAVRSSDGGSRYEIFVENVTWEQANQRCLEKGGHLATVTSEAEQRQLIELAEANNAVYVWLGGYTSYDDYGRIFAHWITGESFSYSAWSDGEPSRVDRDGTPEWYLMLWNIEHLGGWSWNDQRNDPLPVSGSMSGKLAYICEYE